MPEIATSNSIMFEMGTFWIFSILFISIIDYYAAKKLGGKRMLAYKILRMPRFFSLVFVSAYTIVFFVMCMSEVSIKYTTLTFLGIPYFVAWMFFFINVVRRIKAEKRGKPWS